MVVDIDPSFCSTPKPCCTVAWKDGNKTREGVVESKYLYLFQRASQ